MADVNFSILQQLPTIKAPDILGAQAKQATTDYTSQLTAASKGQEERAVEKSPLELAKLQTEIDTAKQDLITKKDVAPYEVDKVKADILYKNTLSDVAESEKKLKEVAEIQNVVGSVLDAKPEEKNIAWQMARDYAEKKGTDISQWPKEYDQKAEAITHQYAVQSANAGKTLLSNLETKKDLLKAHIAATSQGGTAPQGYRWKNGDPSSGELEAIPGGPGAKLTPQMAAAKANLAASMPGWEKAKETLITPDGKVDRTALWTGTGIAGISIPFSEGRTAYQAANRVLFAKLRLESGAAVPDTEIERYMSIYMPGKLDSDEAIKAKLANIDGFLNGTQSNIKGITNDEYGKVKEQRERSGAFTYDPETKYTSATRNGILSEKGLVERIQKDHPAGYVVTAKDVQQYIDKYELKKKVMK